MTAPKLPAPARMIAGNCYRPSYFKLCRKPGPVILRPCYAPRDVKRCAAGLLRDYRAMTGAKD